MASRQHLVRLLLDESERGGAEVKVTPVESADATGAGVDAPLTPRAPEGPPLTARWQAGEGLAPARSSAATQPRWPWKHAAPSAVDAVAACRVALGHGTTRHLCRETVV